MEGGDGMRSFFAWCLAFWGWLGETFNRRRG